MPVTIVRATPRDVSFIAHNLNEADRREIGCQIPGDLPRYLTAAALSDTRFAFVARAHGKPVMAFGATQVLASVWHLWAFGTKRSRRVVPAVTRHIRATAPAFWATGATRVEARSIEGHDGAHRWLESLGLVRSPDPILAHGKGGETFHLFSIVRPR